MMNSDQDVILALGSLIFLFLGEYYSWCLLCFLLRTGSEIPQITHFPIFALKEGKKREGHL